MQSGFSTAASAVGGIPLAGGAIAHALGSAGHATGGNIAAVGRSGTQDAHHLATVLGLLVYFRRKRWI